jgi:hypothetical protein
MKTALFKTLAAAVFVAAILAAPCLVLASAVEIGVQPKDISAYIDGTDKPI